MTSLFVSKNNDLQRPFSLSAMLRNRYFTTIGSSSVRTVADRHRLDAYHNNHCWRAFRWYQYRWPWTTLNPQNWGF